MKPYFDVALLVAALSLPGTSALAGCGCSFDTYNFSAVNEMKFHHHHVTEPAGRKHTFNAEEVYQKETIGIYLRSIINVDPLWFLPPTLSFGGLELHRQPVDWRDLQKLEYKTQF